MRTILCLFLLAFATSTAIAQADIQSTIDSGRAKGLSGFARDFSFSLLKNFEVDSEKWFELYVVSASKTEVHIATGNASPQRFQVGAQEVLTFRIPLAWEMGQSNVIEDKAIRVWSNDADLNLLLISRNPATSATMSILPTNAWGKEYVVASFDSYAYYAQYDYPSEFLVVAKEDNTVVTITPTADIRQGMDGSQIAHPRGKPFSVTLNKHQSVQYMTTAANGDMENFDLTGTVISSSKPIGVLAGVQCANVPAQYLACDHIAEMLLPTDRWGLRYFSVPFTNRTGGDGFLAIAKEDNTSIFRTSSNGTVPYAVLNKNESFLRHDIDEASEWTSDKPFMLVQYMNSTDYPTPGANAQIGDPAMVILSPVGSFQKSLIFQAPKVSPGQTPLRNYASIIVHKDAVNSLDLDGLIVAGKFSAVSIPGSDHVIYRVSDITPGAHSVSADSGVGVYVYAYGWYEATAHNGGSDVGFSPSSSDTTAPNVTISSDSCYQVSVDLVDVGADQRGWLTGSVDSVSNASIEWGEPAGDQNELLWYQVLVKDHSLPMFVRLKVSDAAGNFRSISHSYTPSFPVLPPEERMVSAAAGQEIEFAIPISASPEAELTSLQYSLMTGQSFSVVSAPLSLPAGTTDSIYLRYRQTGLETAVDTLVVEADCWSQRVPLRGMSTLVTGFEVQDTIDFGLVVVGNSRTRTIDVQNIGTEPFAVENIDIDNNTDDEFILGGSILPASVGSGDSKTFSVDFIPTSEGPKYAKATLQTSLGSREVHLIGVGRDLSDVSEQEPQLTIKLQPNPAADRLYLEWEGVELVSGRVINVSGVEISAFVSIPPGGWIDVSTLPSGSYLIEFDSPALGNARFSVVR